MKIEDCKDHENGKRSLIVTMELTDLDDPEFEATIGTLLNMFFESPERYNKLDFEIWEDMWKGGDVWYPAENVGKGTIEDCPGYGLAWMLQTAKEGLGGKFRFAASQEYERIEGKPFHHAARLQATRSLGRGRTRPSLKITF